MNTRPPGELGSPQRNQQCLTLGQADFGKGKPHTLGLIYLVNYSEVSPPLNGQKSFVLFKTADCIQVHHAVNTTGKRHYGFEKEQRLGMLGFISPGKIPLYLKSGGYDKLLEKMGNKLSQPGSHGFVDHISL